MERRSLTIAKLFAENLKSTLHCRVCIVLPLNHSHLQNYTKIRFQSQFIDEFINNCKNVNKKIHRMLMIFSVHKRKKLRKNNKSSEMKITPLVFVKITFKLSRP